MRTLAGIMKDGAQPAVARVAAANALLDRGHGKSKQSLDVDRLPQRPKTRFATKPGAKVRVMSNIEAWRVLLCRTPPLDRQRSAASQHHAQQDHRPFG